MCSGGVSTVFDGRAISTIPITESSSKNPASRKEALRRSMVPVRAGVSAAECAAVCSCAGD